MNHQVSDLIIRIKNATLARRKEVVIVYSKLAKEILDLLVKERFISSAKTITEDNRKSLILVLKYNKRQPAITDVKIVSKPSLRIYEKAAKILAMQRKDKHLLVVSTSKGVLKGQQAFKENLGGEVLFAIW